MSYAPHRTCPSCRRVVPAGPCRRCSKKKDDDRGTAASRGYDAEWSKYSRAWLDRYPWCGQRADGQRHAEHSRCVQRGLATKAAVTDHIVALRAGGSRMDPRNHQSLCGPCNRRKGIASEGGFGRT
jgi:5-methylcytosine-specific restriction protein A